MTRSSAFVRFADSALFVAGFLMVAAGVFVADSGAGQPVLFVLGAGLMIMAVMLPRLSGTIKISPGSLEMTVVQQLDATRREAERQIPDRVEEAVGLAFQKLIESGAIAATPSDREPMKTVKKRPTARLAFLLGTGAIALLFVLVFVDFDEFGAATPPPVEPTPRDSTLTYWTIAALLLVACSLVVFAILKRRGRRTRSAHLAADSSEAFARRVVNELASRPFGSKLR